MQPIIIYSHASGPNSWKVVIVCEELKLPYEMKPVAFADMKGPEFTAINPNGRVPAITDPNTGVTIFESGACMEYLVAEYDKDYLISYAKSPEKYETLSWLHFQISGQGPYFGQRAWFLHFQPGDKIIPAIERYGNEIRRVIGVLDSHLSGGVEKKGERQYLVGDKYSYADIAFIPWDWAIPTFLFIPGAPDSVTLDVEKEFPHYAQWRKRLDERPGVAKAKAMHIAAFTKAYS